jgi:hypothetical protein
VLIIVGVPPGGGADFTARLIGQWLAERLGQQFIIENRSGAASNIGTEAVVRARPDGYTLLLVAAPNAINATLYEKLNFNFIRDIAPVASIARSPCVLVVHPSFPAKTVPEFIAYAKSNPGKINMASSGIGGTPHVAGELFRAMTDVKWGAHVPYRGGAPAITDLIGGQVNSPHCFQKSADDMRTFAMSASRNLDRGREQPTRPQSSGVQVPVPPIACRRAVGISDARGGNEPRSAGSRKCSAATNPNQWIG